MASGSFVVEPEGASTRSALPAEEAITGELIKPGLFGRDEGSVLSQAFIINRMNNANP